MTEEHLFRMLGMCADPITGAPLGRLPNNATRKPAATREGARSVVAGRSGQPSQWVGDG